MPLSSDINLLSGGNVQLAIGGARLKNNAGTIDVKNAADNAFAPITVSLLSVSGLDLVLNSDAAGSSADWTYTLRVPVAGMTAAVLLTLPVDDGTTGQVLSTNGSGVLSWVTAGSTAALMAVDTTSLAFGDSSPVAAFTLPANAVVHRVEVIVDTAFNGTAPTLSVGVSGTTSKYMPATSLDLKTGGAYEYHPNLVADGTTNAIILTYAADTSSAGAARVLVYYSVPA